VASTGLLVFPFINLGLAMGKWAELPLAAQASSVEHAHHLFYPHLQQ
jgi:hypothetical protein